MRSASVRHQLQCCGCEYGDSRTCLGGVFNQKCTLKQGEGQTVGGKVVVRLREARPTLPAGLRVASRGFSASSRARLREQGESSYPEEVDIIEIIFIQFHLRLEPPLQPTKELSGSRETTGQT